MKNKMIKFVSENFEVIKAQFLKDEMDILGKFYRGNIMKRIDIDLTNLCYYDKRNPDCTADDEDIEDHKAQLLRVSKKLGYNKTCSCDNCFYGRTRLAEQLIRFQEETYSEEDMQEYAEFCIRCNQKELPCIIAKDWFEQFKTK